MRAKPQDVDGSQRWRAPQRRPTPRGGTTRLMRGAKRLLLEAAGWVMLLGGLAAIPLPGPGLLITFAGLVLLSRQYAWAERRVGRVRSRALDGAAQSVATWPRLAVSIGAAFLLLAAGVAWIVSPPPPTWWPLAETWWLPGGAVVGASQLASAVIALALLGYSYGRFRARPETSTPIASAIVSAGQPTPTSSPVLRPGAVRRDNMRGGRCEVPCQCLCASAA